MRFRKFVLDTNIWISFIITKKENELIDIIINNELIIYTCDELLQEIRTVLNYKHLKKYNINIKLALQVVQKATIYFSLKQPIKKYLSTDEDDNYIIALALQTNSGFITSGDKHILDEKDTLEKKFKKLKILTKSEFEERFSIK
jgi:putative PIN family toxin of toxin-antitoxin system